MGGGKRRRSGLSIIALSLTRSAPQRAPSDRAPMWDRGLAFFLRQNRSMAGARRTFGPGNYYLKTIEGASHDFGFRAPEGAKFFATGEPLPHWCVLGLRDGPQPPSPTALVSPSLRAPAKLHRGSSIRASHNRSNPPKLPQGLNSRRPTHPEPPRC